MEINISIGERLREEREGLGKTQGDFAALAVQAGVPGATRQSQARYEKGLASPSAAYLAVVAAAGVDVHYVLTGEREGAAPLVLAADERLLLEYYREATPAVRKAAIAALLSNAAAGGGMHMSSMGDNAIQIGSVSGKARVKNR